MVCYFCRTPTDFTWHDACKSPTGGLFSEKTLCPKCGKCNKCDMASLIADVRNQKYAVLSISKRRYAIIQLDEHIGLRATSFGKHPIYLGPHLIANYVKGCTSLRYEAALQMMVELLYPETQTGSHDS